MLKSSLCRQEDFRSSWYSNWANQIALAAPELNDPTLLSTWAPIWRGMADRKTLHRKLWEWCSISQALDERLVLQPGKRGIGFAVGTEPLPSLFAAKGVKVVASDYVPAAHVPAAHELDWASTGQQVDSLDKIHWPGFLELDSFREQAEFRSIDMNNLSAVPFGHFDFSWSSCAFEHLGSLEAGLNFLFNSLSCLKVGGVAVHTTEFNVTSNLNTIETGPSVIYRRKDIEAFDYRLRQYGCALELVDFDPGTEEHDLAYDYPPYYSHGRQHVKLLLDGHITTSLLMIIRKGAAPEPERVVFPKPTKSVLQRLSKLIRR
jgi:hypothetical protein